MKDPVEPRIRFTPWWLKQQHTMIGTFILGWLLIAVPVSLTSDIQDLFDGLPEPVKDMDDARLFIFSIPAFLLGYFLMAGVIQSREHFPKKRKSLKLSIILSSTLYGISYGLTWWILFTIDKIDLNNPFDHSGLFLFVWSIGSIGGVSLESFKEITLAYSSRKISELERDLERMKKDFQEFGTRSKPNDEKKD